MKKKLPDSKEEMKQKKTRATQSSLVEDSFTGAMVMPAPEAEETRKLVQTEPPDPSQTAVDLRHSIGLVADKHGPRMLALTPEERSWILKIQRTWDIPIQVS